MTGFCEKPDRDVPRIQCGYPLPCPHHTFVIEPAKGTITVPPCPPPGDPARIGAALRGVRDALAPPGKRPRAKSRKR